jgi:hypothetical protein
MTFVGKCEICNEDVTTGQRAAYRVHGWEIQRSAGGANQIHGKVREPDRVAHAVCAESQLRREKLGLAEQMTL